MTASAVAQPLVAPSEALTPEEQQKKFHLPPGFEIQLVASDPEIHKPMNITFDSQGRLWVTDTLEYPYPAADGTVPRDTVKILTDHDGDGRADEVTTFVDKLNIPLGVMPIPGGVIVYGIPAIQRCMDTDGDGRADTREPMYSGFGHRDTHGMINSFTRGLDGWLYACHGFANDSDPAGSDGKPIKMNSGNTFRMRIDGSHVEYNTHGQVNPFGLSFDPLGNLYSADCHTMPIYMLLRGAYYPSFGKPHDGLGFGPTMISHNHNSTGIGGIAYYAASQFPPEYRDTVFIGNPVTGRVNHDRLESHGSTYQAIEMPDFITCDDLWFRPVNLQVGPDGALYVADFYNCIIGHYEVPLEHPRRDRHRGRIWRVVYTGKGVEDAPKTAAAAAPRIHDATLDELVGLLGHENLKVRTLATHEIVDRGDQMAIEPLAEILAGDDPSARVHAMWALERLKGLSDAQIERLAGDDDRAVRVHLMKLLAERSWDHSRVHAALDDPDAFVRRAAADALGRHPHADNVQPLAALWRNTDAQDTHLIHVARMALRDQLLVPDMYAAVKPMAEADPALAAQLAEVSLGVHDERSADFVFEFLERTPGLEAKRRNEYLHHVVRYAAQDDLPRIHELAFEWRGKLSPAEQAELVRVLARADQERGTAVPDDVEQWARSLTEELLTSDQRADIQAGIDVARDLKPDVFDTLAAVARPGGRFELLRSSAMEACAGYNAERAVPLLSSILDGAGEEMKLRQQAAAALGRMNHEMSRDELLTCLQTAPQRLAVVVAAALADSPQGATGLMAAISEGKASRRLLQEAGVVDRLRRRGIENFDERLAELTAGLPPEDERIGQLLASRHKLLAGAEGDPARGAAVFEKHCAVCHRIGDKGAKIGPNLDGVGNRGLDRLLEDILDPSRNVDQAFRTTQIVTTDGRSLVGLKLREEGQILVLADSQGKEIRVPMDEIDERAESQLSVMPANVPDLVDDADFVHLVNYLLKQRVAEPQK